MPECYTDLICLNELSDSRWIGCLIWLAGLDDWVTWVTDFIYSVTDLSDCV
jgi:hypothetical protein